MIGNSNELNGRGIISKKYRSLMKTLYMYNINQASSI